MPSKTCAACGRRESQYNEQFNLYSHCSRCFLVLYCSSTCHENDLKAHNGSCPAPLPEPKEDEDKERKSEDDKTVIQEQFEQFDDASSDSGILWMKVPAKKTQNTVTFTFTSESQEARTFRDVALQDLTITTPYPHPTDTFLCYLSKPVLFTCLIDCFRFHTLHNCRAGITNDNSLDDPFPEFQKMLDLAEKRGGILPSYWDDEVRRECEERAGDGAYPSIWSGLGEGDLAIDYEDELIEVMLGLVGERIWGGGEMEGMEAWEGAEFEDSAIAVDFYAGFDEDGVRGRARYRRSWIL